MNHHLKSIYQQRIANFTKKCQKISVQINQIAFLRIFEFLLAIGLLYYVLQNELYGASLFTLFLATGLFLYLVKIHVGLKEKLTNYKNLVTINKNEIKALSHELNAFPNGEEFIDKEHPYVHDLDIFGNYSIFQFLNRTTSSVGKKYLADCLKFPSLQKHDILRRQEAVLELAPRLDWRQNVQARGMTYQETQSEISELNTWLKEPTSIANNKIYPFILIFFPILTIGLILLSTINFIETRYIFMPIIIQLGLVGLHIQKIIKHTQEISKKSNLIKKYSLLFKLIEQENFSSPLLKTMQSKFQNENKWASQQLKELASIAENIEQGGSFVGIIFNGLFMWSLQYLYRLEKWQHQFQEDLNNWFNIFAQIDTLSSLANLNYNNPDYTFPEIPENDHFLKGEEVGHPLIPSTQRVNNPILLDLNGQIHLITGANMAGKSTYLRTVAINLILAMIGAPVCAKSFLFQPIDIYTSMRTKDSLQNSESFFYAELKRLRTIIQELSKNKNTFIILDEILKGTNSEDQHIGSKAFIEQLIKSKGIGLVATHDLSLGSLSQEYPGKITNHCFEIEIIDDELKFDYKLRDGLSKNLNATFLMKKMGISI